MKRLTALLMTLTLAGCASAAVMPEVQNTAGKTVLTEAKELTEEGFISVLTSSEWTYADTVKKTTSFMSFREDGTCIMKTLGMASYKAEWTITGEDRVTVLLHSDGVTYELTYRLVLKDGVYQLRDTERRGVVWTPAEIY